MSVEPLRRSKREKRLVFASFNQSEIYRQLSNPHYSMIVDSSDVREAGREGGRKKWWREISQSSYGSREGRMKKQ